MELKDYQNGVKPTWCPGCGDFSVLRSIQLAAAQLAIPTENMAVVTGIGCSGRLSGYMNTYGFHSVHGRSLPVAQGIKLANRELTVVAAGGDGDGFAIGTNHTIHAIRRNINITYILMNNQVYGLTKGHASPLSQKGMKTKSTPDGSLDFPVSPGLLVLAAGASFYAQGFSAHQEELITLIKNAIEHPGFAMVQVFSPCVTYNHINTYAWFRENLQSVDAFNGGDPGDYLKAIRLLQQYNGLLTGIIYRDESNESFEMRRGLESSVPFVKRDVNPGLDQFRQWSESFRL